MLCLQGENVYFFIVALCALYLFVKSRQLLIVHIIYLFTLGVTVLSNTERVIYNLQLCEVIILALLILILYVFELCFWYICIYFHIF